jgi:hypothetical protein
MVQFPDQKRIVSLNTTQTLSGHSVGHCVRSSGQVLNRGLRLGWQKMEVVLVVRISRLYHCRSLIGSFSAALCALQASKQLSESSSIKEKL